MTSIVAVMKGVKDLAIQAQNPVYMEQVAQSIAAFPQPLPQGYKYFCALDFAGLLKILAVDYDATNRHQQLMFISYMIDNQNPEEQIDAAKLVKDVYSHGLNTVRTHSKFENLQTEGCWTIQGFVIPYMIGKLADIKGTGLVACLVNELQKKVVLLYVAQLDNPATGKAGATTTTKPADSSTKSTAETPKGDGVEPFDMHIVTNLLQDVKGF
jgi:hypothetical protein